MTKTIVVIGLIQSIFGIFIFISKKPRHISFTILTVWLAVIAIFLGAMLLPFEVVDYFKPGIFPIIFLWGPLLYFYISSLTKENFTFKWMAILHVIPVFAIGIHRLTESVVSVSSFTDLAKNPNFVYSKIYYSLLGVSLVTYWFLSLNLILKHRKNIPFHFSNYTAKNSLSWLIFVMSLFLFLFVAEFFVPYIKKIFEIEFGELSLLSFNLTIFVYVMIFFGINQTVIFKSRLTGVDGHEISIEKVDPENKYTHSSLNDKQIEELTETVFSYLKTKKTYLNPEFSLQMMADDLKVPRQKLSQAINIGQKKNFYKIINEFRIGEVKQMLSDPAFDHFSILGIAFECGFNSKTSFNRIFKEETGITPLQFKKSL